MRQATLLFFIILVGAVAGAEFAVVATTVAPKTANQAELWTFFTCLFVTASVVLTLIWHLLRIILRFRGFRPPLWVSLRQATIFSLVVVLGLFFKSLSVLSLWDVFPLIVSAVLIEFFFQAEKSSHHEPE